MHGTCGLKNPWHHLYVCMYVCMYVCIEVALRGDAHGVGRSNWAKGRGPSIKWVQCPNPGIPSIPRHACWNVLTHISALSAPTLIWAAKADLYPLVGGTVSCQACQFDGNKYWNCLNHYDLKCVKTQDVLTHPHKNSNSLVWQMEHPVSFYIIDVCSFSFWQRTLHYKCILWQY